MYIVCADGTNFNVECVNDHFLIVFSPDNTETHHKCSVIN